MPPLLKERFIKLIPLFLDGPPTVRIARPCIPRCENRRPRPVTFDDHSIFSRFPSPIPSGFSVPHWAYLNITVCRKCSLSKKLILIPVFSRLPILLILYLHKLQVFALFLFLELHLTSLQLQVVPTLPPSLKQQVQQLRVQLHTHRRRKRKLMSGRSLEVWLVA
jgi:hypothetical protein